MSKTYNFDERETSILFKVLRNALLTGFIYLSIVFIYNILVLKNSFIHEDILNYFLLLTILIVIFYIAITKKNHMSLRLNLKKIKTDELENRRLTNTLGATGLFMILAALLTLLIKVFMNVSSLEKSLDYYYIAIFSITVLISSMTYKEYVLPLNVDDEETFYKSRTLRNIRYIKGAVITSFIWTLISQYALKQKGLELTNNLFINFILDYVLSFLIFYILDYAFGEINVKRKLKLLKEFED